jgi:P27 family predicted phage terminase small subunit
MAKAAPAHLRKPSRAWWRRVATDYALEEYHERLLTLGCEAYDRATEAREALERDGAFFHDRFGVPKAHPAVAVERDSRLAFARVLRELRLDDEPAPDPPPPRK